MKSFDVLSRELNVFAPHFLEASAGTGKTFAIEHLVTRLVIEGPSPISIEQILVVTFTRAATRELKMRIRRNLLRTRTELEKGIPTADYLQAICEKGPEAIDAALKRIEGALVYYDFAQIFTLHGFCYRALKEGAIEAGMGLSLPDPDRSDAYSLFAPLVKEHLCKKVSLPDYSPMQMRVLLKRYRSDHRKMITAIVGKMSGTSEIASFPTFGALHASVVDALHSFGPVECEKWALDLGLILPQYKGMTDKNFPAQIQLIGELLQKKACTVEEFEQLCSAPLFLEKVSSDNLKARPQLCPEEDLHYPGLLEHVKEVFKRPVNIAKDPSIIFLRIARDLQRDLLPLIEEKEVFSPDVLLHKTAEALASESFLAKLRKKYRAVIVDEFQDTDPLQWKIIQEHFLGSVEAICLVGDPKQSIYSFRNADVYTYLDAARHLGEEAKGHLDTNFRSEEALVRALNLFFSQAKNGWMPLPALGKMLDVPPVKFRPSVEPSTEAALHFFIASGKTGRSHKFPHTELEEKKIYPYIAGEILRLRKEKGLELHEIALLVKDRYQAKSAIDHLKKWQIPAHFKRGSAITDSPAFFSLKLLLDSALFPSDTGKLKAALGSPLIGWSASELVGSPSEPHLLFAKMQMHHLHHLLVDRGFGTFFQAFLHTSFAQEGKSALSEMLKQREIALYGDLRKLAELLIEEELSSQSTPAQLLRFLEDLLWNHNEDEGRLRAVSQEERGSVVVMTTHLSKGLEFDTVFALGVIARHRTFDEAVVKSGGISTLTRFDPSDPECVRAREELDAEKMRQLYVCLTRAKKRLYIPLAIDEDQKEIPHAEASALEHFFTLVGWKPIDLPTAIHHLSSLAPLISYSVAEEREPVVPAEQE
ncbi:MAG: UvrD-helicase domain-containing protein, partial [Chlamydiota bacterium]